MLVYLYFFATWIRINVSWSGSGSDQMIRIQQDPDRDPKHCFPCIFFSFQAYWFYNQKLQWEVEFSSIRLFKQPGALIIMYVNFRKKIFWCKDDLFFFIIWYSWSS